MPDLAQRIQQALAVLGGIASRPSAGGPLAATVLPQIALLRHAHGLATQNPSYADSTDGRLVAGLTDALIGSAPTAAPVRSDLAERATASWAAVPITNSRAA